MKINISKYNRKTGERKIKIDVSDYDVWSADQTLSHIIHPILLKVKEMKGGIPYTDKKDAPHIDADDGYNEDRWDWILDEMIFSFECLKDGSWEDQYYIGESDYNFVKVQEDLPEDDERQLFQMVRGPNHNLTIDFDGMEIQKNRIDNGLRLFGRYFTNLWV